MNANHVAAWAMLALLVAASAGLLLLTGQVGLAATALPASLPLAAAALARYREAQRNDG